MYSHKKVCQYQRTKELFSKYDNFMLLDLSHVNSDQFYMVKSRLPEDSFFFFAKKKIVCKALQEINNDGRFDHVIPNIKKNVIFCFYKAIETARKVYQLCNEFRRYAEGKPGDLTKEDIVIPSGPTEVAADSIALFFTLKMNTSVGRNSKVVVNEDFLLAQKDHRLSITGSKLLSLLKIFPFVHKLEVAKIYEGKVSYDGFVLDFSEEDIEKSIMESVCLVSCVSLATDITTESSVPYLIAKANEDIKKVSLGIGYPLE